MNTATPVEISKATTFTLKTPEADKEIYSEVAIGIRPASDLAFVNPSYIMECRENMKKLAQATKDITSNVQSSKKTKEDQANKDLIASIAALSTSKVILPRKDEDDLEVTLDEALNGYKGTIMVLAKGSKEKGEEVKEERDHTFSMTSTRRNQLAKVIAKAHKILRNEKMRDEEDEGQEQTEGQEQASA